MVLSLNITECVLFLSLNLAGSHGVRSEIDYKRMVSSDNCCASRFPVLLNSSELNGTG